MSDRLEAIKARLAANAEVPWDAFWADEDIAWLIGQLEGQRAKLTAISRQAKAEAWDEGYRSGQRDHCDYWPSAETCDISSANPYRKEEPDE
jgi:hypothetical protein